MLSNIRVLGTFLSYFRQRFGGDLPQDYTSIDLETTGFGDLDVITSIGHCIVRDGQIAHQDQLIFNWTKHPCVEQDWLVDRLARIRQIMSAKGGHSVSYEEMAEQGVKPETALRHYHELFSVIREHHGFFTGTNLYSFDNRIFSKHLKEFTGLDWSFHEDEAIDVGAIEKARQLNLEPYPEESLRKYFSRVISIHAKDVRWNSDHCVQTYRLVEDHGVDPGKLHGADYDAYVSHLILECQRKLGEVSLEQAARRASRQTSFL